MKICIIGAANLRYMPYMYKYTNILDQINIEYDLIYWNRNSEDEIFIGNGNVVEYRDKYTLKNGIMHKIFPYIKYRNFILKRLKNNDYDRVIVLTTIPAILLNKILTTKYKNRYILDYRDYTYENLFLYNLVLKKVIENSSKTCISSTGFLQILPDINEKYIMSHNINFMLKRNEKKPNKNKISIGYVGFIRQYKFNCKIINSFSQNTELELIYHGDGECEQQLKNYIEQHKFKNIKIKGKFQPEEKEGILSEISIINNIFDNDIIMNYATSNRLYEAVFYKIPQLVNIKTYMASIVQEYGIGLVIDPDNINSNEILNWYQNLNWETFYNNCEKFLIEVEQDEYVFKNYVINQFIEEEVE